VQLHIWLQLRDTKVYRANNRRKLNGVYAIINLETGRVSLTLAFAVYKRRHASLILSQSVIELQVLKLI
jgi:hypothetical protein